MASTEKSRILIEPSSKVVEALRLALAGVGLEELVQSTGSSPELIERWVNGSEWVPLEVVKRICEINRSVPEAPDHSKNLSECTKGVRFRIIAREKAEESTTPIGTKITLSNAEISIKDQGRAGRKRRVYDKITRIAVVLFVVPLVGAAVGFLVGELWGAVIGTVTGYIMGIALTFLLLLPNETQEERGRYGTGD